MEIKVSVIVPVYNVEKYIRRCLQSILSQSLHDLELIVVDDRGSDGSMSIVRELKSSDSRVKILEMEKNGGAAAARNAGLKIAQGEYVAFVDSDDWCERMMFEELYEKAHSSQLDWCYCTALKENEEGTLENLEQPIITEGEITDEKRKFMLTRFVAYFWSSVYRREFLVENSIQFPLYRFSEDSYFVWMVVTHAFNFGVVNKLYYHYIMRPMSVSTTKDSTKSKQKIEVFELLLKNLQKENLYERDREELEFLFLKKGFLIPMCIYACYTKHPSASEIQFYFDKMNGVIQNYRQNKYYQTNCSIKVIMFLFHRFPKITCRLIRFYMIHKQITF